MAKKKRGSTIKYTSLPDNSNEFTKFYVGEDDFLTRFINLDQKIKKLEDDQKTLQLNFVQFLGIFTSIIAFIVVFIQAALSNLNFIEIIMLMITLTLVLTLFILLINVIIKRT